VNIDELRAPLAQIAAPAWVVGGGLRDAMLGRVVADVDLAIDGDAAAAAAAVARAHRAGRFPLSSAFGAWRITGGSLPFQVDITPIQGGSLAADLALRDLTVNAMALPLTGAPTIVDPHGGGQDLAACRLRSVGPRAFAEDPVRILRAARLAEQLGFAIDPATAAEARTAAPDLWAKAPERLRDELYRILCMRGASGALSTLDALGGLGVLIPELEQSRGLDQSAYHHKDVLGHTLEVVAHSCALRDAPGSVFRSDGPAIAAVLAEGVADGLSRGQVLALSALVHDMGKPSTRGELPGGRVTFMHHDRVGAELADALTRRLRTASRIREVVVMCVAQHLQLGFMVHRQPLSMREIDAYLGLTAAAPVEMILLTVADRLATRGSRSVELQVTRHLELARQMMHTYLVIASREPITSPVPGDVIADRMGRAPGPWLSEVMREIRIAQLGAPIGADRALRIATRWCAAHPEPSGKR
jgi:poly(A) polymerase